MTSLKVPGFTVDKVGLVADGEPTFDEWTEAGAFFRKTEGASMWWIGDWLNYGEWKWGEKYSQALDDTDFEYQTLANAKWVSKAFEFSLRRENLSWSHHKAAAALENELDRIKALSDAISNGWSYHELRAHVRELKNGKESPEPFNYLDASNGVFDILRREFDRWPIEYRPHFPKAVEFHLNRLKGEIDDDGGERDCSSEAR